MATKQIQFQFQICFFGQKKSCFQVEGLALIGQTGDKEKYIYSACHLPVIPLKEIRQCIEIKDTGSCVLESKIKARLHEEGPCEEITSDVDDKGKGLPSRQGNPLLDK